MKDAYYFPHDSNAKDDPKCVMLIEQLGLEGYGIFWVLIETLRDQPEYKYPLSLLPALARRYNTTTEKMKAVVNGYGLFIVDENDFFSLSLKRRMEQIDAKREQARLAGIKSGERRRQLAESNTSSTTVEQTFNGSPTSKVKESKENKSIGNESKEEEKENEKTVDNLITVEFINQWPNILSFIKPKVSDIAYSQWFETLKPVQINDNAAAFQVKDDLHKKIILERSIPLLKESISSFFEGINNIELVVVNTSNT